MMFTIMIKLNKCYAVKWESRLLKVRHNSNAPTLQVYHCNVGALKMLSFVNIFSFSLGMALSSAIHLCYTRPYFHGILCTERSRWSRVLKTVLLLFK